MDTRVVCPLLRPTAHAIRWLPLVLGAVLGLAVVAVPGALTARLSDAQLTDLLRIAATCVALGAAFLLDDPATRSTPAVPTSRLARSLVRVAVALPGMALWWAAALGVARAAARHPGVVRLPSATLTLEAAALVAAALALAAAAQRYGTGGNTGALAAPAVLVLVAAVWFLPHGVALVLAPEDPQWTAAHWRWAAVLLAALAAFGWAAHEGTIRAGG